MSAFEDFVAAELPRRITVLLATELGYDGDPNDGGAPSDLSAAPSGRTAYVRNSVDEIWWKTTNASAYVKVYPAAGGGGVASGNPRWDFDSGLGSGPPSGEFRFNNASPASVTTIYVNTTDADGLFLQDFLDELRARCTLIIRSNDDPTKVFYYEPTGTAAGPGGFEIYVTYKDHAGALTDGESCSWDVTAFGADVDRGDVRTANTDPFLVLAPTGGGGSQFRRLALKDYGEIKSPSSGYSATGASYALDFENGNVHLVQDDQNFTVTFANWPPSDELGTITMVRKVGGFTFTLPAGVIWGDGSAPTPSTTLNNYEIWTFSSPDQGTTIFGWLSMKEGA